MCENKQINARSVTEVVKILNNGILVLIIKRICYIICNRNICTHYQNTSL